VASLSGRVEQEVSCEAGGVLVEGLQIADFIHTAMKDFRETSGAPLGKTRGAGNE